MSQCQNGGKCISKETSFVCSCSKLYEGDFCQFKRETNYMLNFSRYDTNDFIRLRGFEMNLTEVGFFRQRRIFTAFGNLL